MQSPQPHQQQQPQSQQNSTHRPNYIKKMFQVSTSAGKLHVEVNGFQRYYFVIVAYASLLRMDGGIQLAHPTPYNLHPAVLNLTPEFVPAAEGIARRLGEELKCPVVVSLGIELSLNKKGEEELCTALLQLLSSLHS